MPERVIEVITGRERRRRWSIEEKLRIVGETFEPGASVGQVAARHEVYPGLLFTWRRVQELLPWNVNGIRPRLDQRLAA